MVRGKQKAKIPINRVEELASCGLTHEQIAAALGISESTLYKHKTLNPEIAEAIKRGQAKGLAHVANALFNKAVKGNVTAMIFYLKNRAPTLWKDKPDILPGESIPDPVKIEFVLKDASLPLHKD
ncbi:DNA-binding protein [Nitrosococcus wardiae]|uniref:DNA-binding protein n=2 Tax=Nitrosococcus wardiae TaxID=1814290 RepID=A0A4P7C1L1_9GAMM|nr:DNA-binding protein [Nitrosococcus wardiae]